MRFILPYSGQLYCGFVTILLYCLPPACPPSLPQVVRSVDRYWVECSLDARQGNIPAANISPVLLPALQRGQKICVVRSALPHLHPGDLQLARGGQHSRSHNHSQSLATTNSLPPSTHTTPHRLAHTAHKHSLTPHTRSHHTHIHSLPLSHSVRDDI